MLNSPYKIRHIYPSGPAIESCDEYWNNIKYDKTELLLMIKDIEDPGEQSSGFFLYSHFVTTNIQQAER